MKRLIAVLILTCFAVPAFCEKPRKMEKAKVVWQNIFTQQNGSALVPVAGMAIEVPLRQRTNFVMIKTEVYQYALQEVTDHFIILPVLGMIEFYRDGKYFVILDEQGKKHKFVVTHILVLNSEEAPKPF